MREGRKNRRGRPLLGKSKRVRTSFTLPPEQLEWLLKTSRSLKKAKSELLSMILREYQLSTLAGRIKTYARFPIAKEVIAGLCKRYHIKRFSLFGSVLRSDFTTESDIDVLLEFDDGKTPGFLEISAIQRELSDLLGGRKVDLRTPAELSRYFRSEVISSAEVLYAA